MSNMNGLSLNLEEFRCLPQKQKLDCLYQNQVTTLKLVQGYKFHQKVQYILMSILCGGLGLLFRLQLGA